MNIDLYLASWAINRLLAVDYAVSLDSFTRSMDYGLAKIQPSVTRDTTTGRLSNKICLFRLGLP